MCCCTIMMTTTTMCCSCSVSKCDDVVCHTCAMLPTDTTTYTSGHLPEEVARCGCCFFFWIVCLAYSHVPSVGYCIHYHGYLCQCGRHYGYFCHCGRHYGYLWSIRGPYSRHYGYLVTCTAVLA
eukprot:scpid86325/ scgid12825/ 